MTDVPITQLDYMRVYFACPFCENADLDVTFVVRCKICGAVTNLDSWNSRSARDFENVVKLRDAPIVTTTGTGFSVHDQSPEVKNA